MSPILAFIAVWIILIVLFYTFRDDFPTEKPAEYDQILGRFNMVLKLYTMSEVLSRAEEQQVKDMESLIRCMKNIGGTKTAKDMQRRWGEANRIKRKV